MKSRQLSTFQVNSMKQFTISFFKSKHYEPSIVKKPLIESKAQFYITVIHVFNKFYLI
jgi:hypothetical protein